ncbi:hypothetical protein M1271_05255 [Patescibacteria group bacterium]|nr:hypothetical protein [Patescibacteria group bacterium]MCL5797939.1 hypothetical protein [Patescibacteria group bacterium]
MPAAKKKVNINLIVKEDVDESFSGQALSWALTYGRYIIIITQIVVLSVFFLRFKLDRDHTDLKDSVSQKQALVESISDLEGNIRQVQAKLAYIGQVTNNQDAILKIIRFLQNLTPSDTVYSTLSINATSLSFNATSGNLRSFNFFLRQLQQDNKLTEVTLNDIQRQPDGRISFKITANVNINKFR